MVFYRKYRPQTIADLDNADVRTSLGNVLRSADVPHAFLFTGPKGLGKTSAARIVAKAVNCLAERDPASPDTDIVEPCNTCESCTSITQGTNMDVLEIDAASNRGIDEIRDLKDKINLAPLSAKKKVYIIDEVHMLTTEAFNALLKTLEEPPVHALFILCTTELHKVPETIVSRCFQVTFRRATTEELMRSFSRIVSGEKLVIDDAVLKELAVLSDGGFRDGAKILEEIAVSAKDQEITKAFLEEKYHFRSIAQQTEAFLSSLVLRDVKKGLQIVATLIEQGSDMRYFTQQLVEVLHTALLAKAGLGKTQTAAVTALSLEEVKDLFTLLTKAYNEMRNSILPQLPLELMVIEWAQVQPHVKGDNTGFIASGEAGVSVSSLRREVGALQKQRAITGESDKKSQEKPQEVQAGGVSLLHYNANGAPTPEWVKEFWSNIIHRMKAHNHTLAGVLRGCHLKSFDKNVIIIQTAFAFHKERLEEKKTKDILTNICSELAGNPVQVRVELKKQVKS